MESYQFLPAPVSFLNSKTLVKTASWIHLIKSLHWVLLLLFIAWFLVYSQTRSHETQWPSFRACTFGQSCCWCFRNWSKLHPSGNSPICSCSHHMVPPGLFCVLLHTCIPVHIFRVLCLIQILYRSTETVHHPWKHFYLWHFQLSFGSKHLTLLFSISSLLLDQININHFY